MTHQTIVPCLWFNDQAERAAEYYTRLFSESHVNAISYYPESKDNPSEKPRGSVLTVDFEVAGYRFTALNGGPHFVINQSVSFFAEVDSAERASRLFTDLADGGTVLMPLASYPWSERYGWVQDRFGVSWQVMLTEHTASDIVIIPCLMFSGPVHGKAEPAMREFANAFPKGRIDRIERYSATEGPEGTVKHGRFTLAGQEFIAMDSHVEHGITFNEGISFQVMCRDQAELDHYWEVLAEGGAQGPCGWLKDRFGFAWQVVPDRMVEWMTSSDTAAKDRAFDAIMHMDKLDVSSIQAAFDGAR